MKRFLFFLMVVLIPVKAMCLPVVLDGVSAYRWSYGCAPTAAAQTFSYWDRNGYSGLFDADGDDLYQTASVYDEIGEIADIMGTTSSGSTYLTRINSGMESYAMRQGYSFDVVNLGGANYWERFVAEIDAGNPLLMIVNSSSSHARVNHAIAGIGYEIRDDGLWYAAYNTWHESEIVDWYQWRGTGVDYAWGVYSFSAVRALDEPEFAPVPEPATMILFGLGLLGIVKINRKKA